MPFESNFANKHHLLINAYMSPKFYICYLLQSGHKYVIREGLEGNGGGEGEVDLILIEECEDAITTHVNIGCVELVKEANRCPGKKLIGPRCTALMFLSAQLGGAFHIYKDRDNIWNLEPV